MIDDICSILDKNNEFASAFEVIGMQSWCQLQLVNHRGPMMESTLLSTSYQTK